MLVKSKNYYLDKIIGGNTPIKVSLTFFFLTYKSFAESFYPFSFTISSYLVIGSILTFEILPTKSFMV
jgi:hypothetical protein